MNKPISSQPLSITNYVEQASIWPASGRVIMAQFDDETIIVYQAYRQAIADYAVRHQHFGGEFSFSRMSWIKPNFLWMMYRAGWASKESQEHILAIRLRRNFFDDILAASVASSYDTSGSQSYREWKLALSASEVRLQWDPDHDPCGKPLDRRAVQLGLRGEMLRRYGTDEIVSIEDITPFVASQRINSRDNLSFLKTPVERVYTPGRAESAVSVGLDTAIGPSSPAPEQPQRGETTKPGASAAGAQPQVTAGNSTQP